MPITPVMRGPLGTSSPLLGLLVLGLSLGLGCAGLVLAPASHFDYFQPPSATDAWSPKIAGWQRRELAEPVELWSALPPVAESGADARAAEARADGASPEADRGTAGGPLPERARKSDGASLRSKYAAFLGDHKRAIARDFAAWVQAEAKEHYVPDGPIDHWATLEETLRADGDDCDGLELLAFQGLRELGFRDDEVFRAIVYRPSDGQHHMVTFWFENPDDPWVIDPTGAMTTGMPHMSELPSWVPLKVFGQRVEYSVRRGIEPSHVPDLAANH